MKEFYSRNGLLFSANCFISVGVVSGRTEVDEKRPIAIFSDRLMLPGMHVTLATLLRTLEAEEARRYEVHLFLNGVNEREQGWLRETHARHSRGSGLLIHDYVPAAPVGGRLYYGTATAYGRLYLAQLLPYDRCLYLDCDLYLNRSVGGLWELIDEEHVLVVDGAGVRGNSVDRELFLRTGIDLNGRYFNSGVMGMNLKLWRERGIMEQCEELALQHGEWFLSADQAVLNVVLHDAFRSAGVEWNTSLYPTAPQLNRVESRVYHFEYSPKPWDILGRHLHGNYSLWSDVYRQTAIAHRHPLRYTSSRRLRKILPSLYKAWQSSQGGKPRI
jgi:lipopolysaccharide biosynthesis glycosyltransferase